MDDCIMSAKGAYELQNIMNNIKKEIFKMDINTNRKVIIYHHNDADGIVAGLIIKNWLMSKGNKAVTLLSMDYKNNINFDIIDKDTLVYFLDYSFTNTYNWKGFNRLVDNGYFVVWIDHHESSLKILNECGSTTYSNITTIIDTSICAAYLCWKYVHDMENLPYRVNDFIKYIDSWDTWKHNMPNTEEFHIGMQNRYYNEIDDAFNKYFTHNDEYDICFDKIIMDSIHEGTIIKKHTETSNANKLREISFESIIKYKGNEYNCLVANFPIGNSTFFGNRINDYDIVILYYFNGILYTHSLYTVRDNIDCAEICETFNNQFKTVISGGGHKQAAGFTSEIMFFAQNNVIHLKDQSRYFKPGDYVVSFIHNNLGDTYRIVRITTDFITKEKTVIFHLVPSTKKERICTLSLPLKEFVGEVDKEKYPDCDHKYIFEKIK